MAAQFHSFTRSLEDEGWSKPSSNGPSSNGLCFPVCHLINDKLMACLVSLNFSAIDHNPTFPYSIPKPAIVVARAVPDIGDRTAQTTNWPRVGPECQG
jgi:hypothetical protein